MRRVVSLVFALRKRMGSGDPHGLQNRRAAGIPVAGAFDSHTLPPTLLDVPNIGLIPRRNAPESFRLVDRVSLGLLRC